MVQTTCRSLLASLIVIGLLGTAARAQQGTSSREAKPEEQILAVLDHYRTAMETKSLKALGEVMDPQLLIYEGLHKNDSWEDYRDHHIAEHFKEWKEFKIQDPKVIELFVSGDLAYAVQMATNRVVPENGKEKISDSVQTFVFRKGAQGWKIKHIHSFSKQR